MTIRSVGLIPCRLKSTRLKNKLLKKIYKYPLFAHTYFKSVDSNLDEVYICTGDDEIIEWCKKLNIIKQRMNTPMVLKDALKQEKD